MLLKESVHKRQKKITNYILRKIESFKNLRFKKSKVKKKNLKEYPIKVKWILERIKPIERKAGRKRMKMSRKTNRSVRICRQDGAGRTLTSASPNDELCSNPTTFADNHQIQVKYTHTDRKKTKNEEQLKPKL